MITFSIITITYNAAAVVRPTLESVLVQTYQHVEHIIIDGASTDGTLQAVEDYRDQSAEESASHDVVIVSEPDRGIYDAMNKGLRRATGDYIVFLNAGDTLPSSATLETIVFSAQLKTLETLPAVLYGDTDIVDGEGNIIGHRHLTPPDHLTWRSFKKGMLVCHQAFYARLDIARNIEYDLRYRHSSDVDWCIRVMKEAERRDLPLVRIPAVIAHYLNEGNTTRNHRASLRERFCVMRRHYGLGTTLLMHAWFVVSAPFRQIKKE